MKLIFKLGFINLLISSMVGQTLKEQRPAVPANLFLLLDKPKYTIQLGLV